MVIILSAISFALTLAGFLYGAFCLFRSKKSLYFKLLVSSTGCLAFERLSALVNYLTDGYYYVTLGGLGIFGALLFLLSANYGLLNHIVDDGVGTAKYRLIACVAPVLSILALVRIFFCTFPLGPAVACAIIFILLPIIPASYFSLKHLILPVDAVGLLKATRRSDLCALLFYLSLIISTIALSQGKEWGNFFSVLSAVFSALISLSAARDERLWKT